MPASDPTTPTAPRWIALDGAVNVRDLGGRPVAGGGTVRPGVVLRSDNLQGLTERDVGLLVDEMGLRTVLDLRTDGERRGEGPGPLTRRAVTHHALSFVPEVDAEDRVLPSRAGTDPVEVYLGYLADAPDKIARAFELIADDSTGLTVIHCAAGKDRTGVLAALLLSSVGVERDEVLADFLASNDAVPAILERLLASPTYRDQVAAAPPGGLRVDGQVLTGFLDALDDRHGGVAGWLREGAGVSEETLSAVRDRLVAS
jgi:protein tyrosine/serine phosphatase